MEIIIINGPVPLISVTSSRMKYEKLTEKARIVKISITNVFEIFTILAFSVSFSYFILELVTDIRGTGPFIIIISIIFQIISSLFIKESPVVKDILRSNLLGIHVFSALVGYSVITVSAVYGFLYLTL